MRLIDADKLEQDGYMLVRTYQKDKNTMVHETKKLSEIPSAESDVPDNNVGNINKFIDGLEEIFAELRERHCDDSVCGLCEYEGAYIGRYGSWCNECPGFERDDCFKLSDECRKRWIDTIIKALPSAQPERDIPMKPNETI